MINKFFKTIHNRYATFFKFIFLIRYLFLIFFLSFALYLTIPKFFDYEKNIEHYHLRHTVRPGITGWAQVTYPYGVDLKDARQKFMYDLYYIKHWSIWLEIEICFKTFLVILDKSGF